MQKHLTRKYIFRADEVAAAMRRYLEEVHDQPPAECKPGLICVVDGAGDLLEIQLTFETEASLDRR